MVSPLTLTIHRTGLMNHTKYDAERQIASIDGGALWKNVYSDLEPYGVTAPGGRTATVGVGGFTLGGGNNFYSGKVEFACDNVVNYEVVLANGDIVEANSEQNQDLWKALKGGSSNFGMVTRFDMQAFEANDIYGGLVTHPLSATDEVIAAFSNFVDNIENYQGGSCFSFWSWVVGSDQTVINSALHDTTGAIAAPAYAEYAEIEPRIQSSLRLASQLNMTVELEFQKGFQNVWLAITVKDDPTILHLRAAQRLHLSILFDHGVAQGGNVLGMDRQAGNCVLFQVFMVFTGASLEPEARRRMVAYRETVKGQSVRTGTDVEFEYLNYADKTQTPLETYGEDNIAFMRAVAAKYDPQQILRARMSGGFKLP
ncbi:Uu.00g113640.m01.CDS01 [Anthostomella pinea]|uniref:Uu.00g113640.m01.CDS01 n=1 Tax=Anthostomella pinea TaxID=933095 RepID=A0AAI8VGF9_9PEZI|nr:Uu.00g113640.m01.CDS01 [Anthostomella pinea]